MSRWWVLKAPEVIIKSYTPIGNFIGESTIVDTDARHFIEIIKEIPENINTAEDEQLSLNKSRYTKLLIDDADRIVICNSVYKRGDKLYMRKICELIY